MVVDDLDAICRISDPSETYAVLIIDTDAMLPDAVSAQRLQPITRRYAQVIEGYSHLKLPELTQRHPLKSVETSNAYPLRKQLGVAVPERRYHSITSR